MRYIPRFEKPYYASVEAYLSDLAEDIAMLLDSAKTERFREQLCLYNKAWTAWTTYDEAKRKKRWKRVMGKPECPLNFFSRTYNIRYDPEDEAKRLPGFYSILAFIHDSQLPRLDKINNVIESSKIIEETLAAPESMIEGSPIGSRNIGQIYVIEELFNCVRVDLTEYFRESAESEEKQQDHLAEMLSDIELFECLAKEFEKRSRKVLEPNETWFDLDRSLKGRFDLAVQRLQQAGAAKTVGSLQYRYKNLLHFARGMNIRSFRGWRDPSIVASAHKHAHELTQDFKGLAHTAKENSAPEKPAETGQDISPSKLRSAWTRVKGSAKEIYGLTIERITKAWLDKYG